MITILIIILIIYLVKKSNDQYAENRLDDYADNFEYALDNMRLPKKKTNSTIDKQYIFTMDEALKYINGDNEAEHVSMKTSKTGAGIVVGGDIGVGVGNSGSKTDMIVTQNKTYVSSIRLKTWVDEGSLDAKIENNEYYFNKRDLDDLVKAIDLAVRPANRAYEVNKVLGENEHLIEKYSEYTLHEMLYDVNDRTFTNVLYDVHEADRHHREKILLLLVISVLIVVIGGIVLIIKFV